MVRIAAMSDIHGNTIALDAVLDDIDAEGGADEHWVLGDLVALGHDPHGVLERIASLPGLTAIRGNTDRYVLTNERPPPSSEDTLADVGLLPVALSVAASFAWTEGCLAATGWRSWLSELGTEHRAMLPDGTDVLAVHASPARDDDPGISPATTDEALAELLAGCHADVVLAGHTHHPVDRMAGGVRAVNLGSVSNPRPPDLRASYVIIAADEDSYTLRHRRVDYDHEAVVAALEAVNHPARAWLIDHQRGLVG